MLKIPGKWFENLRIKYKLTISFSLILLLIMVFVYVYFPAKQRQSVYKEMNQRVSQHARALALGHAIALSEGNWDAVHEIAGWVREDPNFAYVLTLEENGTLADSMPDDLDIPVNPALIDFVPYLKKDFIELKVPIIYKGNTYGSLILGMDLKDVKTAVRQINTDSTILLAIIFLIGFSTVWFIASMINKPINLLKNSVNHVIQHGDYSERVSSETRDEAGILASRFNQMIEMIEARDFELNQQFEELRQVNSLKDNFLAATTHDLRSPITAILGFSDLLTMNQDLNAADLKRIGHIKSSAEFLASLVNDVLEISRLESGKTTLKLKALNLTKIIRSSVETLHYMALPKEITLQFINLFQGSPSNISNGASPNTQAPPSVNGQKNEGASHFPDTPVIINGDHDALLRVMNNLISNAIKFTPSGGRITVKMEPQPSEVRVSVTDTGIGISPEKLPLLFDTYSSVSQSGTAGEKGTGLGLSITKNLVEKHGGNIKVSSLVGQGTCFSFGLQVVSSGAIDHLKST